MDIQEYLKELERLKRAAERTFVNIDETEQAVIDGSFEWLVDNLDVKKGEIEVDEDLTKIMNDFIKAVVENVNTVPQQQSNLKQFLQNLSTIQKNNKLFHQTSNNFNIDIAGVNDVQKAVVGQILDQYTKNGLNAHFAAPLKENVFRNILAGANMKQVKQVLKEYILSGKDKSGKLKSYLGQTAQQAVDSYTGSINQELKKSFNYTGYVISGSLIETSSEQCVFAVEESVNGYLSFSDWEEVLEIARNNEKAKLIPGTTIDNLPLNKLHWGCRHDFTPVIRAAVIKPPKPVEPPKPPEPPQKPPEPPKKPKYYKPKPTATPPVEPKEQPKKPLGIKSVKEGKDKVAKLVTDHLGLNITGVTASSEMTVEKMDRFVNQIEKLVKEYRVAPSVLKDKPTQLVFKSSEKSFGVVKSRYYTYDTINNKAGERLIDSINFGHTTDDTRALKVDDRLARFRFKSNTDEDTQDIATVTHEFAHVMSVRGEEPFMKNHPDFKGYWSELLDIRTDYYAELAVLKGKVRDKILTQEEHDKKFAEIFLGTYADKNPNEFMAETFTEYKLKKEPSKYAKKVGLLIDKYFKK